MYLPGVSIPAVGRVPLGVGSYAFETFSSTVEPPSGTAPNDLLFVYGLAVLDDNRTSTPSGYTATFDTEPAIVAYKLQTSPVDTSATIGNNIVVNGALTIRGANLSTPVEDFGSSLNTVTPPSVDTVAGGAVLVVAFLFNSDLSVDGDQPAGYEFVGAHKQGGAGIMVAFKDGMTGATESPGDISASGGAHGICSVSLRPA